MNFIGLAGLITLVHLAAAQFDTALVSCSSSVRDVCQDCATVSEQMGETYALYPISAAGLVNVGYCLPAISLAQAVDYPNGSNPESQACKDQTEACTFLLRQGGPGWRIINFQLEECEAGDYCPFNATVGYYNENIPCDGDNQFCKPNSILPTECGYFYDCDGGTYQATTGTGLITLIVLIVLVVACFFQCRRAKKQVEASRHLAALHAEDDVANQFGAELAEEKLSVPSFIEFEGVGLKLNNKEKTPILTDVTGRFPPNALVALMGPSGCGKTTFMNTMLNRTPYGTTTGRVTINGDSDAPLVRTKGLVGFVPQDDIVHPTMTVFQNLYYHAMLRLPASTSKQIKRSHVQHVIKVLGLMKVQDAIVGSPERRGISGGQKKRVNIGMELVAQPAFIFMDEPTSGLDGAATVSLSKCMALLCRSGLTIVCVIHQPRWLVFSQFTHVLLLGEGGRTVYSGRTDKLVTYLSGLGFEVDPQENPADWMIDVTAGLVTRRDADGNVDNACICPDYLYQAWQTGQRPNVLQPGFEWTTGDAEPSQQNLQPLRSRTTATFFQSLRYLTDRSFRQLQSQTVIAEILLLFVLAYTSNSFIPASAYTYADAVTAAQPPNAIYFFLCVQHRADYGDNMLIYTREFAAGISPLALFGAISIRTFFIVAIKMLFVSIPYYGYQPLLASYINLYYPYLMAGVCWVAFTQWLSILIRNQVLALLVIIFVIQIDPIFSGYDATACIPGIFTDFCLAESLPSLSSLIGPIPTWGGALSCGTWSFLFMWHAQMETLPAYVVNISTINNTNYWMGLVAFDDLQAPPHKDIEGIASTMFWVLYILHSVTIALFLYNVHLFAVSIFKKRTAKNVSKINACCNYLFSLAGVDTVLERLGANISREDQDGAIRAKAKMERGTGVEISITETK